MSGVPEERDSVATKRPFTSFSLFFFFTCIYTKSSKLDQYKKDKNKLFIDFLPSNVNEELAVLTDVRKHEELLLVFLIHGRPPSVRTAALQFPSWYKEFGEICLYFLATLYGKNEATASSLLA